MVAGLSRVAKGLLSGIVWAYVYHMLLKTQLINYVVPHLRVESLPPLYVYAPVIVAAEVAAFTAPNNLVGVAAAVLARLAALAVVLPGAIIVRVPRGIFYIGGHSVYGVGADSTGLFAVLAPIVGLYTLIAKVEDAVMSTRRKIKIRRHLVVIGNALSPLPGMDEGGGGQSNKEGVEEGVEGEAGAG